jgi:hypothetical protein
MLLVSSYPPLQSRKEAVVAKEPAAAYGAMEPLHERYSEFLSQGLQVATHV